MGVNDSPTEKKRTFRFENVTPELRDRMRRAFHKTIERNLARFREMQGWDERITTLERR